MIDQTVRIGIVGAGANTKSRHIPLLKAIEGVQIVSVCNRTPDSSKRAAAEFSILNVYDDWGVLVAADDTDAIVIGTWPYMHCAVTVAALEAGKHVLCEARMAMNAAEARRMLNAATDHPELVAQLVPSPFSLEVDDHISRLIAEGFLGDVLAVDVRSQTGFIDSQRPLSWRDDADLSGLNVMALGIWYEAVMRWIGHATRVSAMGRTFVKTRRDDERVSRAIRVPDHLHVNAEMACGAQLHMQLSQVTGLTDRNDAWLFGSEGTLRFADGKLYGATRKDAELHELTIPAQQRRGWQVESDFINSIRRRDPVKLTSFADGLKYMEFTEAVARSIAEQRTIPLPLQL